MEPIRHSVRPIILAMMLAMFAGTFAGQVKGNVYATNIKLNGAAANAIAVPGGAVNISFILNEPASAGTTIQINFSTDVVRTINIAPGNPGTFKGTNTVVWNLTYDSGVPVVSGTYTLSVSPGSLGYTNWTRITDDIGPAGYVYEPRGIAVDRNPASHYYGRIFVGNALQGPHPGDNPGDVVGIQKLNADGSPADEGAFSDGGHSWAGNFFSPWKIEVSDDELVYINDWTDNGEIYRWDLTLSPESQLHVLRPDNWGNGGNVNLSGPAIFGVGTNTQIWLADTSNDGTPSGLGMVRYKVSADGTCATNDTGTTVAGVGQDLNLAPVDVALDKNGNIFCIQSFTSPGDDGPRVMRFPAYDPATNAGVAEYAATWVKGTGDDTMSGANGIAVDSTGTLVAVAFRGMVAGGLRQNGSTKVFQAANGALVTTINTGSAHDHTDVAWDAVGNLYDLDNYASRWRAYSPPGSNRTTTAGLNHIFVAGTFQLPVITKISRGGGQVAVTFTGATNDPPTAFTLQSAAPVTETFSNVPASSVLQLSPGLFRATAPLNGGTMRYYRIQR
jgi:hypothetical protein